MLAVETMESLYPEPHWFKIFTNGSYSPNQPNAGAGVFCSLFAFYIPVGTESTAYNGKITVICVAVEQLLCFLDKFSNVVFLFNSQAARYSMKSVDSLSSGDILKCQMPVKKLQHLGKSVTFQWIPFHCGIESNEMADALSKKGTSIQQINNNVTSFSTFK